MSSINQIIDAFNRKIEVNIRLLIENEWQIVVRIEHQLLGQWMLITWQTVDQTTPLDVHNTTHRFVIFIQIELCLQSMQTKPDIRQL